MEACHEEAEHCLAAREVKLEPQEARAGSTTVGTGDDPGLTVLDPPLLQVLARLPSFQQLGSQSYAQAGSNRPQRPLRPSGTKLSLEALRPVFNLSREEAARRLGMGLSSLKRHCASLGVHRWPHRKLASLHGLRDHHLAQPLSDPVEQEELLRAIQNDIDAIMHNPDHAVDKLVVSKRVTKYKHVYANKGKGQAVKEEGSAEPSGCGSPARMNQEAAMGAGGAEDMDEAGDGDAGDGQGASALDPGMLSTLKAFAESTLNAHAEPAKGDASPVSFPCAAAAIPVALQPSPAPDATFAPADMNRAGGEPAVEPCRALPEGTGRVPPLAAAAQQPAQIVGSSTADAASHWQPMQSAAITLLSRSSDQQHVIAALESYAEAAVMLQWPAPPLGPAPADLTAPAMPTTADNAATDSPLQASAAHSPGAALPSNHVQPAIASLGTPSARGSSQTPSAPAATLPPTLWSVMQLLPSPGHAPLQRAVSAQPSTGSAPGSIATIPAATPAAYRPAQQQQSAATIRRGLMEGMQAAPRSSLPGTEPGAAGARNWSSIDTATFTHQPFWPPVIKQEPQTTDSMQTLQYSAMQQPHSAITTNAASQQTGWLPNAVPYLVTAPSAPACMSEASVGGQRGDYSPSYPQWGQQVASGPRPHLPLSRAYGQSISGFQTLSAQMHEPNVMLPLSHGGSWMSPRTHAAATSVPDAPPPPAQLHPVLLSLGKPQGQVLAPLWDNTHRRNTTSRQPGVTSSGSSSEGPAACKPVSRGQLLPGAASSKLGVQPILAMSRDGHPVSTRPVMQSRQQQLQTLEEQAQAQLLRQQDLQNLHKQFFYQQHQQAYLLQHQQCMELARLDVPSLESWGRLLECDDDRAGPPVPCVSGASTTTSATNGNRPEAEDGDPCNDSKSLVVSNEAEVNFTGHSTELLNYEFAEMPLASFAQPGNEWAPGEMEMGLGGCLWQNVADELFDDLQLAAAMEVDCPKLESSESLPGMGLLGDVSDVGSYGHELVAFSPAQGTLRTGMQARTPATGDIRGQVLQSPVPKGEAQWMYRSMP